MGLHLDFGGSRVLRDVEFKKSLLDLRSYIRTKMVHQELEKIEVLATKSYLF